MASRSDSGRPDASRTGQTRALRASAAGLRLRRPVLRVVAGPDVGKVVAAAGDRLVVGTHASAELRLADRTVSRFHCELVVSEGRLLVRDLGSRNGTSVDGVAVVVAPVGEGAAIEVGQTKLRVEREATVDVPVSSGDSFGALVGRAPVMRRVFELLARAATSDATLLLGGETGTGKELAARAVHDASARASGPFVVVDAGAVPATLLESELFGHEKGAFTGADRARRGAFRAADGGTLFLDEIGELPTDLQPKLLRALESREVKPVGSEHTLPVNVRVVAATHRDLREEVNARRFRADLYYRLAVLEVRLPALRERGEDVAFLAETLLERLGASTSRRRVLLDDETKDALARSTWPGNVRELRNHLERLLALGPRGVGAARETTPSAVADDAPIVPLKEARAAWNAAAERAYLEDLLARCRGNVRAAARRADVDRPYLYRRLKAHGLR
ncbi:MAG: sigma 54-dependent Fis family transcriptional regulator [Sandaracinus sp.]|nr:sigma 54-dependent Fis family transcriptional regulator [Sandaracinus sp.]